MTVSSANEDHRWMQVALQLAARGEGFVEPNPMVGCVLVADGELIGEGWHQRYGGLHAEREAIEDAKRKGNEDGLRKATAYVTLEPCCHHGKTPPCTDALIEAQVQRVVVSLGDPFARVAGRGIEALRAAGIDVELGVLEESAKHLCAPYLKHVHTKKPWVIAKWAMSLDGKIASSTGHSRWISGEESRLAVQRLRSRMDAIVVGSQTAIADDPMLVAHGIAQPPRRALRVVVDSRLRLDPQCKLVQTARDYPLLLWVSSEAPPEKVELLRSLGCSVVVCEGHSHALRTAELLNYLGELHQATNVLVEGGGQLLGGLMDSRSVDQCEVFVAPRLIGGASAPGPVAGLGIERVDRGPEVVDLQTFASGADVHIRCRLHWL